MSVLVIDNIGLLVTGEPSLGEGPLGLVRDAAVVIDGERVASIEPSARPLGESPSAQRRVVAVVLRVGKLRLPTVPQVAARDIRAPASSAPSTAMNP